MALYFLLARFGMALFSLQPSNITLLWLPSGVGLLMCLSAGARALPFVCLASFLANYPGMALSSAGLQILHTAIAACADSLAAWLAAFMLRRHLPSGLSRPFDLIPFALFVCIIPTLVSATILAGNLVLGGYIPTVSAVDFIFMLLVADSLGILLCYPLRSVWLQRRRTSLSEVLPWLLETAGVMAVVHLAFVWLPALIFLLIPAFLYMIFRKNHLGVHLTLAMTVALIIAEAAHGVGPFQSVNAEHGYLMLVFFLFSTALTVIGIWLQQDQLLAKQELIAEQNSQLAKAKLKAEAADIAKSHFLANMSHEMRTPLHQAIAMAQLMRREAMSEKQTNRLDRLETSCRRMNGLVDSVLELTQLEAGMTTLQEEPFVIDDLLGDVASLVEEQASEKHLPVTVETSLSPIGVQGDVRLIKMALFNYVSNAVRFTEQGQVILRACLLEETDLAMLVRFEVQDTGIGIAPEDMGRLFSAFEQVDNSATRKFGGLGVGLSMSKKIAARLGGDVGCDSNAGQGSTFWFSVQLKKSGYRAG